MEIEIYSDINSISPEKTDKVTNVASIRQAIYNLLNTRKKERLFLPEYGIDLEDFLFEPINDDSAFYILQQIDEAISLWEPRVFFKLGSSTVEADTDNNAYRINLVFTIVGLDEKIFNFEGLLER